MDTRILIVFGGVYSSLGKGIVASSIARILLEAKFKVAQMKLEPYINVNPGMMSPFQHGEVFVTNDGGETDLDLGNYERFLCSSISKNGLLTTGQIYQEIINNERNGKYNGKTVQVVPHVTNHIKQKIFEYIKENKNPDFLIIEVGGTVGDMESIAMIEALCEIELEITSNYFLPILCAPLIHLSGTTSEVKTKPCQHAVRELGKLGIKAKMLILRTEFDIDSDTINKLSTQCHIVNTNIFNCKTEKSIYFVPQSLLKQNILFNILKYFNLKQRPAKLIFWNNFVNKINKAKLQVTIAMVGKYMDLHDSYLSVIEALKLSSWYNNSNVVIQYIDSEKITKNNVKNMLKKVNGVLVPGGFGPRGTEGMMIAIEYCRVNKVPYLGICYGMQLATINFARSVLNWKDANTTEINAKTTHPVFDYIDGRMRLGGQKINIVDKKSLTYKLYKTSSISQRHRHRWEFNNKYIDDFKQKGYIITANSDDKEKTAEIVEYTKHPFFVGCQFHPEFSCTPAKIDPVFDGFIKASLGNT